MEYYQLMNLGNVSPLIVIQDVQASKTHDAFFKKKIVFIYVFRNVKASSCLHA